MNKSRNQHCNMSSEYDFNSILSLYNYKENKKKNENLIICRECGQYFDLQKNYYIILKLNISEENREEIRFRYFLYDRYKNIISCVFCEMLKMK